MSFPNILERSMVNVKCNRRAFLALWLAYLPKKKEV